MFRCPSHPTPPPTSNHPSPSSITPSMSDHLTTNLGKQIDRFLDRKAKLFIEKSHRAACISVLSLTPAAKSRFPFPCNHRKTTLNLSRKVLEATAVRNFPCVSNVEHSAMEELEQFFQQLHQRGNSSPTTLYLSTSNKIYAIKCHQMIPLPDGDAFPHPLVGTSTRSSQGMVCNYNVGTYLNVQLPFHDALHYWQIVNKATKYEEDIAVFDKDARRASISRSIRTQLRRERGVQAAAAIMSVIPHMVAIANTISTCFTNVPDCAGGHPTLDEYMPDIVAIASLSKAVRARVHVDGDAVGGGNTSGGRHEHGVMVHNNVYKRFWNARYLFHLSDDEGVALDTVTGNILNARFQYHGVGTYHCYLSPVSEERWAAFVGSPQTSHGSPVSVNWGAFRALSCDMIMHH